MLVLRRTVGTAITILASERITVTLSQIDWLGACAVLEVQRDGKREEKPLEMGPGEIAQLHPDVRFQLLRLSYATHEGTPARTAEFGIDAPRSILIRRAELDN